MAPLISCSWWADTGSDQSIDSGLKTGIVTTIGAVVIPAVDVFAGSALKTLYRLLQKHILGFNHGEYYTI